MFKMCIRSGFVLVFVGVLSQLLCVIIGRRRWPRAPWASMVGLGLLYLYGCLRNRYLAVRRYVFIVVGHWYRVCMDFMLSVLCHSCLDGVCVVSIWYQLSFVFYV